MKISKYKNLLFQRLEQYIIQPKLLVLSLPYIIISSLEDYNFSTIIALSTIISFLFIDFLLKKINKFFLYYIIILFTTYFLYSLIIYNDTYYTIHHLRFRNFSLIFLLFFAIVFYFPIFYSKNFTFINVVVIIFSFLQFIKINNSESRGKIFTNYNLNTNAIKFKTKSISKAPVILLICDGLTSTNEIFRNTNDKKDLNFENFLKSNKYYIKNDFKSESAWTQFSLTSMLNLNLHKSDTLIKLEKLETNYIFQNDFRKLITNNLLVDSLSRYGIKSYSFGVLPFLNGINTNSSFYLWKKIRFNYDIHFLRDYRTLNIIFRKSVLNFVDSKYLNGRTFVLDSFRKYTLDKLISNDFEENTFYYFHYYAPHSPFSYFEEFPFVEENDGFDKNNFMIHTKYRRFMLKKLINVLKLPKFDNVRIILTGDHGYRSELTNEKTTMAAFKGFDSESIKHIRTVQDIGSFILYSMK